MEHAVKRHSCWMLLWGIFLIILGVIAITYSFVTTMASIIFLGTLLLISGLIILVDSFKYLKTHQGGTFFFHLVMGLLYAVIGILFIWKPVVVSASLTMLLAVFFIVVGLFRIIYSLMQKPKNWGWVLFNGLVSLVLGILIMIHWPSSSLIVIGLFIGIDLLIAGWTFIALSFARPAVHN